MELNEFTDTGEDPFQQAIAQQIRIDEEEQANAPLAERDGPSVDLFLAVCNPQTQALHERLGVTKLVSVFQNRNYWTRRARMLLGDYVPYYENAPGRSELALAPHIFTNYAEVMTLNLASFASIDPKSVEVSFVKTSHVDWILYGATNPEEVVAELSDIVRLEQLLDSGEQHQQSTTPYSTIDDIFVTAVADSRSAAPPDRSEMLRLAVTVCKEEMKSRKGTRRAALPTTELPSIPSSAIPTPLPTRGRGRSRRIITDEDGIDELTDLPSDGRGWALPSSPVLSEGECIEDLRERVETSKSGTPAFLISRGRQTPPRLGYGLARGSDPFVLP